MENAVIKDREQIYPMISKVRMVSESLKHISNLMGDDTDYLCGSAFDGMRYVLEEVGDWLGNQV